MGKYVTDVPQEVDIIRPALGVTLTVGHDETSYMKVSEERRHSPDVYQTARDARVAGHRNSVNAPENIERKF